MLNHCVLTGNLGHDPEVKYFGDHHDQPVASFSLAFRAGKNRTCWIRVACFGRLAEAVERHLHQGDRVAVVGFLDQQHWENADGQIRNGFQIVAQSVEFIKTDGRGFGGEAPGDAPPF
jgi:single-strand DNA-binding protein